MELHEQIKAERNRRGWSQADLARRVGISQPAIKKIEAGQTQKSRFLGDILRVLNLSDGSDVREPTAEHQEASSSAIVAADDALHAFQPLLELIAERLVGLPHPELSAQATAAVLLRVISGPLELEPGEDRAAAIRREAERIAREFPQARR